MTVKERDCIVVTLLALFVGLWLLLPVLGLAHVGSVSEAREGSVVLQILRAEQYVLPLRHNQIVPSKPPLTHWIGALLATAAGRYDELMLRLPSLLAGSLLAGATAGFLCMLAGAKPALFGAAVLLSSYGYVHLCKDGRVDMVFTLFAVLPILLWISAAAQCCRAGKRLADMPGWVYHAAGVSAGAAVLAKGPLGIVLPALVIGCCALWFEGLRGLRLVLHPGWVWSLAISCPWYILATQTGGSRFVGRQIVFENLLRFTGGTGITPKPFYHYFVHYWDEAAPWSFALLLYLVAAVRAKLRRDSALWARLTPVDPGERFALQSSLLWIASTVFFLSLSVGKRPAYLLPTFPALALAAGLTAKRWHDTIPDGSQRSWLTSKAVRIIGWSALTIAAVFGLLMAALGAAPPAVGSRETIITLAALPAVLQRLGILGAAHGMLFFAGSAVCWQQALRQSASGPRLLLAGAAVFLYLQIILSFFAPIGLALKQETHTYRRFAAEVRQELPANAVLNVLKDAEDESLDGFLFYYPSAVKIHEPEGWFRSEGYYIVRRWWIEALPALPSRKRVRPVLSGGRAIDLPEEFYTIVYYSPTA